MADCVHFAQIDQFYLPGSYECAHSILTGDEWVHLRTCQTCGVTLRCDDSPNKHMTKHCYLAGHPVVISAEPGERLMWCYKDEVMAQY